MLLIRNRIILNNYNNNEKFIKKLIIYKYLKIILFLIK